MSMALGLATLAVLSASSKDGRIAKCCFVGLAAADSVALRIESLIADFERPTGTASLTRIAARRQSAHRQLGSWRCPILLRILFCFMYLLLQLRRLVRPLWVKARRPASPSPSTRVMQAHRPPSLALAHG